MIAERDDFVIGRDYVDALEYPQALAARQLDAGCSGQRP
jgi:hypothetical protein